MSTPTIRDSSRYGWRPQLSDSRDNRLFAPRAAADPAPATVDLRPGMPPVYDQGSEGSCTANAACAALEYAARRAGRDFTPSRQFVYFNTRLIEGTTSSDAGATCRDAAKAVARWGACAESDWAYDPALLTVHPAWHCYTTARGNAASRYAAVGGYAGPALGDLRHVLGEGDPVMFGMSAYESFEGDAIASTGVMAVPASSENLIGGHCVLLVGYDDARGVGIVRNSWGADWGDAGYFYMPYAYLAGPDCRDFWVLRAA